MKGYGGGLMFALLAAACFGGAVAMTIVGLTSAATGNCWTAASALVVVFLSIYTMVWGLFKWA